MPRVAVFNCPYCKHPLNGGMETETGIMSVQSEGDIGVCVYCGGIFMHSGLGQVTLTDAELDRIASNSEDDAEIVRQARLAQVRIRGTASRQRVWEKIARAIRREER